MFGLGLTIGAGIYVLIGTTVGRAGHLAPWAFALAAIVMAPTAASFAELATRFPVSAGEAAYVEAGFQSKLLATVVGLLVALIAIVSAAALARGSAGYISAILPAPRWLLSAIVVIGMGLIAVWGIRESTTLAGIMAVTEIFGLVLIIAAGLIYTPALVQGPPPPPAPTSAAIGLSDLLSATVLAFFAFIGFEALANIAEEVHEPERNLPLAIAVTLVIATFLYILVVWTALAAVPRHELAASEAPLSLVFQRVAGASSLTISMIAIVSTINGIIIQIVMASRVLFGMAARGLLPDSLARVNARTRTPLLASILATLAILALSLTLDLDRLAALTSQMTLLVFALVNAALVRLKHASAEPPRAHFVVPFWVPITGAGLCVSLLIASFLV
jgi:amino acid transporter